MPVFALPTVTSGVKTGQLTGRLSDTSGNPASSKGRYVTVDREGTPVEVFLPGPLANIDASDLFNTDRAKRQLLGAEADDLCDIYSDPESNYLNEKAICPWTIGTDFDPMRSPEVIAKAECKCTEKCFSPDMSPTCQPFYYSVPVIDNNTGQQRYDQIPVSCICAY